MKKITITWIVLITILVLALSIIGISVVKKTKPYKALEEEIIAGMKIYYGQDTNLKKLPSRDKKHKVTIGELEAFGININNIINKDTCEGYGIVTGEKVSYSYKSYIKCKNYTSKNYNKYSN